MTSNYESLLRERQIHRKSRIVPIVLVLLLATIAVVTSVVLLAANNRTRPSLLPSLLPHLPEYAEELSLTNVFPSSPNSTLLDEPDRPLILYAYHETKNARLNAEFFIRHALHDGADFLFILNGETDLQKVIPKADHIKVRQRPNTCFDIGSYAEVLLGNDKKLLTLYKKFIMINASVRGPFIPTWSNQCWSESYLSQVTEEVKLVGMSYNCKAHLQYPKHVQSMLLATDRMGMDILLEKSKMAKCAKDMDEAVEVEVTLSPTIVDYGYKVNLLLECLKQLYAHIYHFY